MSKIAATKSVLRTFENIVALRIALCIIFLLPSHDSSSTTHSRAKSGLADRTTSGDFGKRNDLCCGWRGWLADWLAGLAVGSRDFVYAKISRKISKNNYHLKDAFRLTVSQAQEPCFLVHAK